MRPMIAVVARVFAARRSASGGTTSATRERLADADRDRPARERQRQLLALLPHRVRVVDADRDDACARAHREHRQAVLGLLELARRGCACPRGTRAARSPSSRILVASRNASTSACAAVDRVDAAVAASQPTTGQSKISRLPSQWIRRRLRAGVSHAPTTTGSPLEMWLTARITGPVRGTLLHALDRRRVATSARRRSARPARPSATSIVWSLSSRWAASTARLRLAVGAVAAVMRGSSAGRSRPPPRSRRPRGPPSARRCCRRS